MKKSFPFLLLTLAFAASPAIQADVRPTGSIAISSGACRSEAALVFLDNEVSLPIRGSQGRNLLAKIRVSDDFESVRISLHRMIVPVQARQEAFTPSLVEFYQSEVPLVTGREVCFLDETGQDSFRYRITLH